VNRVHSSLEAPISGRTVFMALKALRCSIIPIIPNSAPFFWKSVDLPTPYVLTIANLLRGFSLQESIVKAICLAPQTFLLTPLAKYDQSAHSGKMKPRSQPENRGFSFSSYKKFWSFDWLRQTKGLKTI
jgi:hypothetical protein